MPERTTERRPSAISPARSAAFEILQRVAVGNAHSDDLLHGPGMAKLSQADRDLTTTLVLGVLRWQIALDARVRPFLSRPDAKLPEAVAITLRLGAFQLLHLERIPAHAAINESVELARAAGQAHAAGMVNAVLRKLVNAAPVRKPLVESTGAMAERLGHPAWMVERWVGVYGRRAAELICEFDQQQPPCAEIFADAGETMPVMDPGSRLVAELAAASQPDAGRVWDCCAAPGGKTLVLARRLPESELLATDASPVRLNRLAQRLSRDAPGRKVETVEADAAALPASFGSFDLILCDVPCSGTGTLARNPEIRHRLAAADLQRQAQRQRTLLAAALKSLAPGGRLVYSTCSLEPEENERIVATVMQHAVQTGIRQAPVGPVLETLRAAGKLGADTERQVQDWTRGDFLRTVPGANFSGRWVLRRDLRM